MSAAEKGSGVQSVTRALDVLEALAAAGGELGLSELAATVSMPLPTIHRLVRTLVGRGYVRQLPNRRYTLGVSLIPLGDVAMRKIGTWAEPVLTALVDEIGETANLAMLDGDQATYVAQAPSRHSMRMFTEVGRRVEVHCTGVGKALLSQLDDAQVREILARAGMSRHTPTTFIKPDGLLQDLAATRRRGYAIDDGEQEIGVKCVAVPVPGAQIAVSVSGPEPRMTPEVLARAVPALQAAATRLADEFAEVASA